MKNKKSEIGGNYFATGHLQNDLRSRAAKSTAFTLLSQGIKVLLHLLSIVIMARLLSPSDFGIFAMAAVFTGLAIQLIDNGLTMATIQKEHINHAQASNIFWANVAFGVCMTAAIALLSPVIAFLYGEPLLRDVLLVSSLAFSIGSLSAQHSAILRRQMQFKNVAIIDATSIALGIAAGIASATQGLGYWALVILNLSTVTSKTLLCWFVVKWRPSLFQRNNGTRPLIKFGANLAAANIVGYLTSNTTPFAVGYIGGSVPMGHYNRSFNLASLPSAQLLPPILNVMQSALMRVASDQIRLKKAIASLMSKIAMTTMLISLIMFLGADWIVLILLGEGWEKAAEMLEILAVATIATPITTFTAIILVATGNSQALLRWRIITLAILILSLIAGSFWGVEGVIYAHALSAVLVRMPGFLIYSSRFQPTTPLEYLYILAPPAICCITIAFIIKTLENLYTPETLIEAAALYLAATPILYFALCFIIPGSRREIKDIISLSKIMISRNRK